MNEKIIEKISELSEIDNITEETAVEALKEGYWDSLAIISYMVFAKSELGVEFENSEILENAQTVGEICRLTTERMK